MSHNTYEGIPPYYLDLIKKGQNDITRIQCNINELCATLDFEIDNNNKPRIDEIKEQITDLVKQKMSIRKKIESYTKCQCKTCR